MIAKGALLAGVLEAEAEFEYGQSPAVADLNGLLWLAASDEGRSVVAQEMALAPSAPVAEVLGKMNRYGLFGATVKRSSGLWLDDDYYLELPPEASLFRWRNQSAWDDWFNRVTLQAAFRSTFKEALSGALFSVDFEKAGALEASMEAAGVSLAAQALLDDVELRSLLYTEQLNGWVVQEALGSPAEMVNWFYSASDARAEPSRAYFDAWVGEFGVYFGSSPHDWVDGNQAERDVEIPLSGGAALFFSTSDTDLSDQSLEFRRSRLTKQWVELQLPRFSDLLSADFNGSWMGSLQANDFSGLIDTPGTRLRGTANRSTVGLGEGLFSIETQSALAFSLVEPPRPPGGSTGLVVDWVVPEPSNQWAPMVQDFCINQPFSWALLAPDDRLLASGRVENVEALSEDTLDGWFESAWFGWLHNEPFRNSSFGVVGDRPIPGRAPWLYHAEHGWIYSSGIKAAGAYHFDLALQAWVWASAKSYPWLYLAGEGWGYYLRGEGGRWFYSSATRDWRFVAD